MLLFRKGRSKSASHPTKAELRLGKDVHELSYNRYNAGRTVTKINFPDGSANLTHFTCTICPQEGIYRGGSFTFDINVPRNYPFQPPCVTCLTKVLHPNFSWRNGEVVLGLLKRDWNPVLSINNVIFQLQLLFAEPNSDLENAASPECAQMLRQDTAKFRQLVRQTLNGGMFFGDRWEPNCTQAERLKGNKRTRGRTPTRGKRRKRSVLQDDDESDEDEDRAPRRGRGRGQALGRAFEQTGGGSSDITSSSPSISSSSSSSSSSNRSRIPNAKRLCGPKRSDTSNNKVDDNIPLFQSSSRHQLTPQFDETKQPNLMSFSSHHLPSASSSSSTSMSVNEGVGQLTISYGREEDEEEDEEEEEEEDLKMSFPSSSSASRSSSSSASRSSSSSCSSSSASRSFSRYNSLTSASRESNYNLAKKKRLDKDESMASDVAEFLTPKERAEDQAKLTALTPLIDTPRAGSLSIHPFMSPRSPFQLQINMVSGSGNNHHLQLNGTQSLRGLPRANSIEKQANLLRQSRLNMQNHNAMRSTSSSLSLSPSICNDGVPGDTHMSTSPGLTPQPSPPQPPPVSALAAGHPSIGPAPSSLSPHIQPVNASNHDGKKDGCDDVLMDVM